MVRFKNRFLVVDLIWGESARAPPELSGKVLDKALRESLSRNFGVIGVARTNWSLQGTALQERVLLRTDETWLLTART
jgi:RNase P/RNase MRP subunit POP5